MELVLGTAQLCVPYGVMRERNSNPDHEHALGLLHAAASLGVRALDTAPGYGEAEATIGAADLALEVHTKVDPAVAPAASLAGSLARLRREHVEVLYVHEAGEVLRRDSAVLAAAHELVGAKVGRLGISVYEPEEFDAALTDPRIGAVQAPINLLDRRFDIDRLQLAAARDVRVYARSVLLQGVLAAAPRALTGNLEALAPFVEGAQVVAATIGRSVLELALGWVRSLPGIFGVIVGAGSVRDLEEIVTAWNAEPLSEGDVQQLEALELPPPQLSDPRRWTGTTA